MKKLHKTYVFLLCLTMLCACQKDFNELTDSNQRYAEFSFRTDSLFSKALDFDGIQATYPQIDTLPTGYCLRITAYCYDEADALVASKHIFTSLQPDRTIGLTHLQHGVTYRFVFLAEVVKYDSQVDFFETWYQLGTDFWNEFYLFADYRNYEALLDVVGMSTFMLSPDNQLTEVSFAPITYNGYCVFTHTDYIQKAYVYFTASFLLYNLESIEDSGFYKVGLSETETIAVYPCSLNVTDDQIWIYLLSESDTTLLTLENPTRSPFVATINCQTKQIEQCDNY